MSRFLYILIHNRVLADSNLDATSPCQVRNALSSYDFQRSVKKKKAKKSTQLIFLRHKRLKKINKQTEKSPLGSKETQCQLALDKVRKKFSNLNALLRKTPERKGRTFSSQSSKH